MKYWFNTMILVTINNMFSLSIWAYYYQQYAGAASVKIVKVFIFGGLKKYNKFHFYLKGDKIDLRYCTHLLTN